MKKLIYLLVTVLAIFSSCESDLNGSLEPNNGTGTDIEGCMDSTALNYNPDATIDDGSCVYENEYCPICEDAECDYLITGYCENQILCPICGDPSCDYMTTGVCENEPCPMCGDPSCDYMTTGVCENEPCPMCGDPSCDEWGECVEECPLCGDPFCDNWGDCNGFEECPICGDPFCLEWGNCYGPGK